MHRFTRAFLMLAIVVGAACGATSARGASSINVVVDCDAPQIEQFAASELCGYLEKLFGEKVSPVNEPDATSRFSFIVGTRAAVESARIHGVALSDQGIVLKSSDAAGRKSLVVGGGSSSATLWAVYDLATRWGVRPLLHGDVLPERRAFKMPSLDTVEEPNLRVRQWRVLNEHAMGPISWGIADYKPVIDQLAKLRFNRLLLYIWPEQPFLPLECHGIRQTSGTLFFGNRFPIISDMVGRSLFGQAKEFWNPDLPLPEAGSSALSQKALSQAAVKHVRAIIDYARGRGMQCVVPASLLEYPREFRPLIEHTKPFEMPGSPTIGPGPDASIDDPAIRDLARAVLRTTINTYPGADYVELGVPEWRSWANQYPTAWNRLEAKYHVSEIRSLESVLADARNRRDYPGGAERAVSEVKADIVALWFFDSIITEPEFKASHKKFMISSLAEELYPLLARVLPQGSETLNFVDYTPSRIVKRLSALAKIPATQIPSTLIYTLHDDNIGVLPQLMTGSLAKLTDAIRAQGWAGFSTRYWMIGDHDPCVAYIAQAAWDARATPRAVYEDQIRHVYGDAALSDMLRVYSELEAATVSLEWHGLGISFPTPAMMLQHWTPGQLSIELKDVATHYEAARDAATRAMAASKPSGREEARYWVKRLTFGIEYMDAIEAVHAAATAQASGDSAGAVREAKRALELATQAITAFASIARDRSDLGAIATMNEFVIRPLRAKLASLEHAAITASTSAPTTRATDFQRSQIYRSQERPGYTSWVSFFKGNQPGEWYIGFVEMTRPKKPAARATKQWVYEMGLPRGYDSSKFFQELVLLKSTDAMKSWNVVSRTPTTCNGGSFGQTITPDGTLHRFIWACYSRDPAVKPSDIYQVSHDAGRTWIAGPKFVSDRFAWYPQRLRTLRDGTLVLCCPRAAKWGAGTDYPIRTATRLDVVSDMEMMIYFSQDQGKTWSNPLPILSGQNVSETDFVELPDGNLLFMNNSIFATPGRQFVYRDGNRFTPGPLERVHSGTVPETICLTDDCLLVGCLRPGTYFVSDDLGQNWKPLDGAPASIEVYQPWIHYLGQGRIACAGHYGADDPIGGRDQSINLHRFSVIRGPMPAAARLWIERGFDEWQKRFLNSYTISLSAGGKPVPDATIDVWYVARGQPGYDSFNSQPLETRMKLGGKRLKLRTGPAGTAKLNLPEFDGIASIHASYQLVIRFNADRADPRYAPAELPQLEYYANSGLDP